jgi:Putative peptidoglycan binding domain
MRQILAGAALAAFLLLTWNAHSATTPPQKTPPKKTAAKKVPAKKAPATQSASTARKSTPTRKPATGSGARTTTARKGAKQAPARTATWRNRQTAPTPDRYREIQQALAAKGYLKAEDATGVWNPNSVDALKRFQAEQKIESTGKINSLSLIALGLGPKHETAAAKPAVPAQPPVPDVAPGRM